jgi:hypothetical protein
MTQNVETTEVVDSEGAEVIEEAQGGTGTEEEKAARQAALRKAYSNATTRLREAYRSEFDELYAQEAETLGVNYTPRPTPEQKAEQEVQALLEKYPHLRDKI